MERSPVIGRITTVDVGAYKAAVRMDPCAYCPTPGDTEDHIVPRALGGVNAWHNLTGACRFCNTSKGTRSLLGFLLLLRVPGIERMVLPDALDLTEVEQGVILAALDTIARRRVVAL